MKTIHVVAGICLSHHKIYAMEKGYGPYKYYFEFPGGKVEENENLEDALKREFKEELNAEIKILSHFYKTSYTYPEFHVHLDYYLCEFLSSFILNEHLSYRLLDVNHLYDVKWLSGNKEVIQKLENYLKEEGTL